MKSQMEFTGDEWSFDYRQACLKMVDLTLIRHEYPKYSRKLNLIEFKTMEYMIRLLKKYPFLLNKPVTRKYVFKYLDTLTTEKILQLMSLQCSRLLPKDFDLFIRNINSEDRLAAEDLPIMLESMRGFLFEAEKPSERYLDPFAIRLQSIQQNYLFSAQTMEVLMCLFLFDEIYVLRYAKESIEPTFYKSDMQTLEILQTALDCSSEILLTCLKDTSQLVENGFIDPDFRLGLKGEVNKLLNGLRLQLANTQ